MIRINLLGLKAKPKPIVASRKQVLVFAGLLLAEVLFLFLWHQKMSTELADATRRTREASAKIDDLKRVKISWEQWQAEKADLDRQSQVFQTLRAAQIGPPMLLQYLSYALTPLEDTLSGRDEAKAQELAGWNPKWDPRRVWFKSVKQKDQMITFEGQALDHEDVAEFYRRMESSDFFSGIEPGLQSRRVHADLGIRFVEFTATASFSYLAAIDPEAKPAATPSTPSAPGAPPGGPGAPASGGPGAPASSGPGAPAASLDPNPLAAAPGALASGR
mgnify:CR=1 FL=1